MTQDAFIDKFIDGEVVGSDAKRFDKYVGELFKLAETDEKNGKMASKEPSTSSFHHRTAHPPNSFPSNSPE